MTKPKPQTLVVLDIDDTLTFPSPFARVKGTYAEQLAIVKTAEFAWELATAPVAPWVHSAPEWQSIARADQVIVITGRQRFLRRVTLQWLRMNDIRCDALYHCEYGSDGYDGYVRRKQAQIMDHSKNFGIVRVFDDSWVLLDNLAAWIKTYWINDGLIAEVNTCEAQRR